MLEGARTKHDGSCTIVVHVSHWYHIPQRIRSKLASCFRHANIFYDKNSPTYLWIHAFYIKEISRVRKQDNVVGVLFLHSDLRLSSTQSVHVTHIAVCFPGLLRFSLKLACVTCSVSCRDPSVRNKRPTCLIPRRICFQ